MNKIKFANTEVEAWKVKSGTVVMQFDIYYHIAGFVSNDRICLFDFVSHERAPCYYETDVSNVTWLEPH